MLSLRSIGLAWLGIDNRPRSSLDEMAGLDREPTLGTHLVTSRRGYTHHGIYVGCGMVVHYAGLSKSLHPAPVEEVTISQFSMGRAVWIIEHGDSRHSPQMIVLRARSRLGENKYHVLRNNCEHFCNWCISGLSRSSQVERSWAVPLKALDFAVTRANQLSHALGTLRTSTGRAVPAG